MPKQQHPFPGWPQGLCIIGILTQEAYSSKSIALEGAADMTATTGRQSLIEAFAQVPDPRSRHGRRYQVASILGLAVCALTCGARSRYAIAQWGKMHRDLVCEALGITRRRTPDCSTFPRVFRHLKVEAFEAALGKWLVARGLKKGEGIAVDGKTLRGIHGEEIPGVHLVSAFAHETGIVLDQEAAPGKGQELEAVKAILDRLDRQGHVVTGDALLAQKAVSRRIVEKGGTTSCA